MERIPTADLHHDPRVHLLIDEESLCEPATEIVTRHVEEVIIACRLSCALGGAFDHRSDTALGEVNDRLVASDVRRPLEPMYITLDIAREISVARLSAASGRILPFWDAESEVVAIRGAFDVFRCDLRDLEGAKADEPAELYHEVVAVTPSCPP